MRTIVELPDDQVAAVAQICSRQGISRAEAIRQALARMIAEQESGELESAFGAWKNSKLKSREFVDQLRDEWTE
ncbi:MAG: ribbon-helix-helix protein, CopG family [Terrimicrobiaceae bacterium]